LHNFKQESFYAIFNIVYYYAGSKHIKKGKKKNMMEGKNFSVQSKKIFGLYTKNFLTPKKIVFFFFI